MSEQLKCRMKPYIQPFERQLALAELAHLSEAEPRTANDGEPEALEWIVQTEVPAHALASRLSYWEVVTDEQPLLTDQVLREATASVTRNGIALGQIERAVGLKLHDSIPNRRSLRYGPHGLHEYRGKFFPQLVKALINISDVPEGGVVADPMSGSGTTLVETTLAGCHGLGLDMNPLSVFMGQTKCAALAAHPQELIDTYDVVERKLSAMNPARTKLRYLSSLHEADREYLSNWFSTKAFAELDCISQTIPRVSSPVIRALLTLSLSNIIRDASWQKAADLRVRKEVRPDDEIHPIKDFLDEFKRAVKAVVSCAYQLRDKKLGTFDLQEGDARALDKLWKPWHGKVDAVITSPPYATALPYLDTDRLSLIYLGFLTRQGQRRRDYQMIGNREITEKMRQEYWQLFGKKKSKLPHAVVKLIEKIDRLNTGTGAGFRRRNLPALLSKYFFDMKEVLSGIGKILKPGAWAYVVIGDNHTVAGGEKVEIKTAGLLSEIAESVGLHPGEHMPMDMLVSRDIFKKNAVASETILCLRRPERS